MSGRFWTWRETPRGGRWFGWSPTGAVLLAFLLGFVPLVWWLGPAALLGLLPLLTWERVSVDASGVTWIRGLGPIPLVWRRFPGGGRFIVYELLDAADGPHEVAYCTDGREHVLLTCSDPERVRSLLADAADRSETHRS